MVRVGTRICKIIVDVEGHAFLAMYSAKIRPPHRRSIDVSRKRRNAAKRRKPNGLSGIPVGLLARSVSGRERGRECTGRIRQRHIVA